MRTWSTHSGVQQSEMTGRDYGYIRGRRQRLIRLGVVSPETRASHRRWTQQERDDIEMMCAIGLDARQIAKRLPGRTAAAVWLYADRTMRGLVTMRMNDPLQPISLSAFRRLTGIGRAALDVLISDRALHVVRARRCRKKGTPVLINMERFGEFLANRRYWMAWTPEKMTDPDWRHEALRLRAEADGRWVALAGWCREHHYSISASDRWQRSGYLQTSVVWQHRRYAWSTELESFIPPSARIKIKQPRKRRRRNAHNPD